MKTISVFIQTSHTLSTNSSFHVRRRWRLRGISVYVFHATQCCQASLQRWCDAPIRCALLSCSGHGPPSSLILGRRCAGVSYRSRPHLVCWLWLTIAQAAACPDEHCSVLGLQRGTGGWGSVQQELGAGSGQRGWRGSGKSIADLVQNSWQFGWGKL